MGCLKNVTRALFLTVVIVGFMAFGGQDFIKNQFNNFMNPSHDVVLERAQKIGDFSKVNKEFEIEKAAGILGYNAVLAEHKATGQKMVVVDSGKKVILSAEDIKSPDAESRILAAINKIKYQSAAVEEFHVIEQGTMKSYGKEVPYVKFRAKLKKLPIGEISGIISVVKDEHGNDKVLVSANEKNKYSQLISNEFFKEIK
ncbi:MAG: hypothetical protein DK841_00305 [Candidatus Melainabacteria bacterium]|nr:MAG: hypothetical protein DK841_00305 [Candidatus Melainabacteria bacterium]